MGRTSDGMCFHVLLVVEAGKSNVVAPWLSIAMKMRMQMRLLDNQTASAIRHFEYSVEELAMATAKRCVDEQLRANGGGE